MPSTFDKSIALAMTGASGAPYGLRLLELLIAANCQVQLMISKPGQVVINMETDLKLPGQTQAIADYLSKRYSAAEGQLIVYGQDQWTAPVASGSGFPDAMVICPCTMGSLSAVANGGSRNLIERAADVAIKEQRKLIIVPRETPLSAIHLENMLKLSRLGVMILPANPGFYNQPKTMDDLVDFVAARILDQLGVEQVLQTPWGK